MAVNISDDLFKVIKSMTVAEAGNFPKYIKRYNIRYPDEYLEIFRILRKQDVYDEPALKNELTSRDVKDNFSYHKNLLSELVIDSLVSYHGIDSVDYKLHRMLESANLIASRLLYEYAFKLFDKAKKLATDFEKYYILLQVLDAERKLLKQIPSVNFTQQIEVNSKSKVDTLKKIEIEDHFSAINDKVFALYRELNLVKHSKADELEAIMLYPVLQDEENAVTFDSRLKYHNIYALYNQLNGNYKQALIHREKIIQIWENRPQMIGEMPIRYRTDLSNLLAVKHFNKDYENFDDIIKRIEKIKEGNSEENAATFREVYHQRLAYLLNNNKTAEALKLIPEIEKGLQQYEASISPTRLFSFYFNIAVTYFINKKFAPALPWIERITGANRNLKVRTDLRDFAAILELFIFYETGKATLVEARMHAIRNRLNKQGKGGDFEKTILHYITRLIDAENDSGKKKECLLEFHRKLVELSRQPGMDKQLGLEEITLWASDKCNSLSLSRSSS